MNDNKFHTFKGDMNKKITASMEDYIEMIYRLSIKDGFTRIHELASSLNVKPSSVTKMVKKISEIGYLKYQKYGVLVLKPSGYKLGKGLLNRHVTIEKMLRILKVNDDDILSETEKIEHTLSNDTYKCIEKFINLVETNIKLKEYLDNNL